MNTANGMAPTPLEQLEACITEKANELIHDYEALTSDDTINAQVHKLLIENRLRELRDTMAGRICPMTDDNVRRLINWLTALN